MKRINALVTVLVFSLMLGATPLLARDKDTKVKDDDDHYRGVNATELASAGMVVAVMVGGAGYVLLRRRTRLGK
jgi:hypothetical protein